MSYATTSSNVLFQLGNNLNYYDSTHQKKKKNEKNTHKYFGIKTVTQYVVSKTIFTTDSK